MKAAAIFTASILVGSANGQHVPSWARMDAQEAAVSTGPPTAISGTLLRGSLSECQADMERLRSIAASDSEGRRPDGRCYSHVSHYIDESGYGGIRVNGFDNAIPPAYWAEAHMFADYLNKDGNAARLGLKNIGIDNPYNAPAGSIVVVRAGTPGTANPTAGDIAVADHGSFWNGGAMGYGGSGNFGPGNNYVLGVFVPTICSGGSGPGPSPGPPAQCSSECQRCIDGGGGRACASRCDGCSDSCVSCVKNGGGRACDSRCE